MYKLVRKFYSEINGCGLSDWHNVAFLCLKVELTPAGFWGPTLNLIICELALPSGKELMCLFGRVLCTLITQKYKLGFVVRKSNISASARKGIRRMADLDTYTGS